MRRFIVGVCLALAGCGDDILAPPPPDAPMVDAAADRIAIDSPAIDAPAIDAPDVDAMADAMADAAPDAYVPRCGDGVWDPAAGELCDTGILGGAGVCPTSCDDGDPCTTDTLVGANTCQAHCTFTPITAIGPADGCCPSGANSGTDPDCPATCGNGVVDTGELCDTGITSGTGACPTSCTPTSVCFDATLISGGTCQAHCSQMPVPNRSCSDGNACNGAEVCDTQGVCRPGTPPNCDDGNVCTTDSCNNASGCVHAPAPSTTLCRPSAGPCDVAENCDGLTTACPADQLAPATMVCRPAAGVCDIAEMCSGFSAACPADQLEPSSFVCRPSAGTCDVAEHCTGSAVNCPADGFAPATMVCRPSAGACDVAENCTGSSASCPADGFAPSTTVCRPSAGACDIAENCSGTAAACPADAFQPSTTVCRPSAGVCDVAENCTGTAAACPADAFQPSTLVCRPSAGVCDVAENCTGTAAACPADGFAAAGTSCGASTCLTGQVCSGSSASCPAGNPRTISAANSVSFGTTHCLTLTTGALAGIEVDLKDQASAAITGATLTLAVSAPSLTFGNGTFVENNTGAMVEGTGASQGRYYLTLRAPTSGTGATITVTASATWSACGQNTPVQVAMLTVNVAAPNGFNTAASGGGVAGCPAVNNLRVRVVQQESASTQIAANVLVGGSANAAAFYATMADYVNGNPRSAPNFVTNAASGSVEFHDFDPAGPLTAPPVITAIDNAGARAYLTTYEIDASDQVLPLTLLTAAPATYNYTEQTTGTVTGAAVTGSCSDVQLGIGAGDLPLDFFGTFDTTQVFGRNQCVPAVNTSPPAMPGNFWVPQQNAGAFCLGRLGEGQWLMSLSGTGRVMSMPFGTVPLATAQSLNYAAILEQFTFTNLAYHTGIGGAAANVNTNFGDTFPSSLTVNGVVRPPSGGTTPDMMAMTAGDLTGASPAGMGNLFFMAEKAVAYSQAAPTSLVVPFGTINGGPAAPSAFASVVALYLQDTARNPQPTADKINGTSARYFRSSPFAFGGGNATVALDGLLDIPSATANKNDLAFQWTNTTQGAFAPQYGSHELQIVTTSYPPQLSCETNRQALVTLRKTEWIVIKGFGTADPACAGSECFTLPTLPSGWPRAGDAALKLSGFDTRVGSGRTCTSVADCAAGESCTQVTVTPAASLCMTGNATQTMSWHMTLDRRQGSAFSPTNFAFGVRQAQVTHVATNRIPLPQCKTNADCTSGTCQASGACR